MVTFGDMMALLLTFFVLLLSFAQLDRVKFEQAAGSMKDAFGVQRIQQVNPMPTGERMISVEFHQEIILVRLKERLEIVFQNTMDEGEVEMVEVDEGFLVRINNDKLFTQGPGGTLRISKAMEPTLQEMATLLADIPNVVHITGHTDARPAKDKKPAFPNNWILTAYQAAAVVDFLAQKGGVDATRLEVRGLAEFHPKDTNETQEGQANNRRIEIMITRATQAMSEDGEPDGGGDQYVDANASPDPMEPVN
ncbi:MAG: flagellar motor protein MotB [Magnetococcales bacterium]|nr:flagellar motor protein MotB [Magnetococcales bacterium]